MTSQAHINKTTNITKPTPTTMPFLSGKVNRMSLRHKLCAFFGVCLNIIAYINIYRDVYDWATKQSTCLYPLCGRSTSWYDL